MSSALNQFLQIWLFFVFRSQSTLISDISLKPIQWKSSSSILCSFNISFFSEGFTTLSDEWILINNRLIYKLDTINTRFLITNLPISENRYVIAVYLHNHDNFKLIGVNQTDIIPDEPRLPNDLSINDIVTIDYNKPYDTLSKPILSTYYTTIDYHPPMSYQNITYNMKQLNILNQTPNLETVIRTDDNITLYDTNLKWNWTLYTQNTSIKPVYQLPNIYYMAEPLQFSYYCIYTNPSDRNLVPDCPNAIEIIKEHSKMLYSAGVDILIPDDTNLVGGPNDISSYIRQIRPNENILNTFNELRKNGSNTPYFAIWNQAQGVQWKTNLEFYANYSDLIYTAPDLHSPGNPMKKVYFINNNVPINQTIVELIESNGGKNDIQVITFWSDEPQDQLNNGVWTFLQPCTIHNGSTQTTSLEMLNECNIKMTVNSSLGSQISASFDAGEHHEQSITFSNPTKLNGRTFQLIIQDCLKLKPDNIHIPSFNEHVDGCESIPYFYGGNNTWSNGLYKDKQRSIYCYDTYGSEMSRTFEPTVESGDYYWKLFESCSRVLRMEYYFGGLLNVNVDDDNVSICNIENEICCNNLTRYVDIWSLKLDNFTNYITSNNIEEVNYLKNILDYTEICAVLPYANTSVFCESNQNVHQYEAHMGPFILYFDPINPYGMIGSLAVTNISRVPIYRCIDMSNMSHFMANDSKCNGIINSKTEELLGYASSKPSTAMGRRLMRCKHNTGVYYHTIGDECFDNKSQMSLLGFAL